jgi:predicted dehydrogenase
MTRTSIGVAVIGAGMAGRAHAAGYRNRASRYSFELTLASSG